MRPAHSYEGICHQLSQAFRSRYPQDGAGVQMVGLLFARPASAIAQSDIVPNLSYFHARSANHIDFFCAGYGSIDHSDANYTPVLESNGWQFNARRFDSLRRELESQTTWRYGGGSELILANARYDPGSRQASIDFGTVVVCALDEMKEHKAISSVEIFFEDIIRFAESSKGNDPTWGFSDTQGLRVAGSWLKRLLLSLLPKKLGDAANRAAHFAVRDVGLARNV